MTKLEVALGRLAESAVRRFFGLFPVAIAERRVAAERTTPREAASRGNLHTRSGRWVAAAWLDER